MPGRNLSDCFVCFNPGRASELFAVERPVTGPLGTTPLIGGGPLGGLRVLINVAQGLCTALTGCFPLSPPVPRSLHHHPPSPPTPTENDCLIDKPGKQATSSARFQLAPGEVPILSPRDRRETRNHCGRSLRGCLAPSPSVTTPTLRQRGGRPAVVLRLSP